MGDVTSPSEHPCSDSPNTASASFSTHCSVLASQPPSVSARQGGHYPFHEDSMDWKPMLLPNLSPWESIIPEKIYVMIWRYLWIELYLSRLNKQDHIDLEYQSQWEVLSYFWEIPNLVKGQGRADHDNGYHLIQHLLTACAMDQVFSIWLQQDTSTVDAPGRCQEWGNVVLMS